MLDATYLIIFDLFQKPVDNLLFGFLFGESEGHKFDELLPCDLADCRLVNKACVHAVGVELWHGGDSPLVHDDSVALGVSRAEIVAVYTRDVLLMRLIFAMALDTTCAPEFCR